jgi:hypothetical protein
VCLEETGEEKKGSGVQDPGRMRYRHGESLFRTCDREFAGRK